jgi:Holliday junction resolvase RusA-like endonuclease
MKTIIRLKHVPPSTNALFANIPGRGRIKSDRYRTWRQAAGWDLASQHLHNQRWTEPVYLTIVIGKLGSNADIDNRCKALIDLLAEHQIIPGDTVEHVRGVNISLAWEPFDGVEIAITAARRPDFEEAA